MAKLQFGSGELRIALRTSLGYAHPDFKEISIAKHLQEKRLLKLSNTARSVSEIASQASLLIPMTMPSTMLPSYVTIDPKSQWHVSALLCTSFESMTLPSRLKAQGGTRETLDQIASALNINGNQNIAKLRMSIDQKAALNGHDRPGRLEVRAQSRDMRIPSRERSTDAPQIRGTDENDVATFDMDFFPTEATEQGRGRQSIKKAHVFGQAENYRDDEDQRSEQDNDEEEGYERARRRAAGLPIIQKLASLFSLALLHCPAFRIPSISKFSRSLQHLFFFLLAVRITYHACTCRSRIPLSFPLLDSFPRIFAQSSPSSLSLSVKTSLSTDTMVALRFKSLQHIVSRAIGIDEREALSNSLGEIAEAYEEGWDSGSDEDDD